MKKALLFFTALTVLSNLDAYRKRSPYRKHSPHKKYSFHKKHSSYQEHSPTTAVSYDEHSAATATTEEECWLQGKRALEFTNEFRAQQGLPKLAWNQSIAEVARKHSINMGNHVVGFGHDGFKNRTREMPYCNASAENVYMANHKGDRAQRAVNAWIKSEGHRHNLVGDYNTCGIGVYKNTEGYWYFTQLFAQL